MKLFRFLLFPFSLLYGIAVFFRNMLYDFSIIASETFDVPVISVGNLNVGGTGKSPHIEYLIRILKDENKVATMSRGYGRKTRGFFLAKNDSAFDEIGDEPRQFKQKFPDIAVAVDSNRARGIKKLEDAEVVLLDDAFQHRAVKPGLSVLLTDYTRLYTDDSLMPVGNLREWKMGANRADIIIVTRIPEHFSPMEKRIIIEKINPKPYQSIFFSYIRYGNFIPLNKQKQHLTKEFYFERNFSVLLITGIASSSQLFYYLKSKIKNLRHLKYRDHHRYTLHEVQNFKKIFDNIASDNKIILTTEKDAMRLSAFTDVLKDFPVFFIPIEIGLSDQNEFNQKILNYVRTNKVNSRIHKKQS